MEREQEMSADHLEEKNTRSSIGDVERDDLLHESRRHCINICRYQRKLWLRPYVLRLG